MTRNNKKVLISGVKPTGRPHVGNYLGAMKQFVDLQDEYKSYIFIADYHALTSVTKKEELSENILGIALDYLAIGLDPKKIVLFKQSDVPQVTELAWIFNCLATIPYLMRAHAYKDAEAKNKETNVGLFDYPILMAADIVIQGADVVPVGKDQQQHVEIARDMARKFNERYGETFLEPQALIMKEVESIPGVDGQKMSKSYNNTIPLFASDEELKKAVMSIATDSLGVDEPKKTEGDTLFTLHSHFDSAEDFSKVREGYEKGGMGYKESKEILIKNLLGLIGPLREKRAELARDVDFVRDILAQGGSTARANAEKKMQEVREKVGLTI